MAADLLNALSETIREQGASDALIAKIENELHLRFEESYRALLKIANGVQGRLPSGDYFCLFPVDQLPSINRAAAAHEFVPGWLIFASDLGGKSYLFRMEGGQMTIAWCYDEVMGLDTLKHVAPSFEAFCQMLG